MFGSPRNGILPYFTGSGDDPDEYWADVEGRHAQHARHVRNLTIVTLVLVVAAAVVGWRLLTLAALPAILLLVELVVWRRTKPGSHGPAA